MTWHFLYLDPGAGSLLLQILAGGFIAGLVFFKTIWFKVKSIFTGSGSKTGNKEEE